MASERFKSSISKALLTAGKLGWFNSALTVLILYWIRLVDVGVEAPEGVLENAPLATVITANKKPPAPNVLKITRRTYI